MFWNSNDDKTLLPKETRYEFTDSFSVAQSFAYAALYGALPIDLQKDFRWEESTVGGAKRIISMYSCEPLHGDKGPDKNWDQYRWISLTLDNKERMIVHLKQRLHGDGSKDEWRVVAVAYPLDNDCDYLVIIEPFMHGKMNYESTRIFNTCLC